MERIAKKLVSYVLNPFKIDLKRVKIFCYLILSYITPYKVILYHKMMNLSSQNHHGIKNLSYPINLYSVLDINDYFQ